MMLAGNVGKGPTQLTKAPSIPKKMAVSCNMAPSQPRNFSIRFCGARDQTSYTAARNSNSTRNQHTHMDSLELRNHGISFRKKGRTHPTWRHCFEDDIILEVNLFLISGLVLLTAFTACPLCPEASSPLPPKKQQNHRSGCQCDSHCCGRRHPVHPLTTVAAFYFGVCSCYGCSSSQVGTAEDLRCEPSLLLHVWQSLLCPAVTWCVCSGIANTFDLLSSGLRVYELDKYDHKQRDQKQKSVIQQYSKHFTVAGSSVCAVHLFDAVKEAATPQKPTGHASYFSGFQRAHLLHGAIVVRQHRGLRPDAPLEGP